MSQWAVTAKVLYQMGGKATRLDILLAGGYANGLKVASQLGLMNHGEWRGRGESGVWWLTQKGIDFCEGRLRMAPAPHRGGGGRPPLRLVSTWLASLPRDIRIGGAA